MTAITADEKRLWDEVRADPDAYARLQDKCRWEQMSQVGVLREWGDPRKWPPESTQE